MKKCFCLLLFLALNSAGFQLADISPKQNMARDETPKPPDRYDESDAHQDTNGLPFTESQEQLDLIMRTFKKLPAPEIERMGVDISERVIDGTTSATMLRKAWIQRQAELKEAVESMVKPAEHMAQIAQKLRNHTLEESVITDALVELESFLSDMDNAKDFHTIGGWPILLSLLHPSSNTYNIRMRAAWIVGTAVKNNYDYQLWVLERDADSDRDSGSEFLHPSASVSPSPSCLELLVDMLAINDTLGHTDTVNDENCKRKALYALSSAARGNTDVQEALQHTSFLSHLTTLLHASGTSHEIQRKIWAFISDMLEERHYIKTEFLNELQFLQPDASEIEIYQQISKLQLLGDQFCHKLWSDLAKNALINLNEYIRIHYSKLSNLSVVNALMKNLINVLKCLSVQCHDMKNDNNENISNSGIIEENEFQLILDSLSNESNWRELSSANGNETEWDEMEISANNNE